MGGTGCGHPRALTDRLWPCPPAPHPVRALHTRPNPPHSPQHPSWEVTRGRGGKALGVPRKGTEGVRAPKTSIILAVPQNSLGEGTRACTGKGHKDMEGHWGSLGLSTPKNPGSPSNTPVFPEVPNPILGAGHPTLPYHWDRGEE